MKRSLGALLVVLLSLGRGGPLRAQEGDGWVLPPGVVRLSGAGEYAGFDRVHGGGYLGETLSRQLVPASFPSLRPLEASLSAFLASTATSAGATPFTLDPGSLTLGTPDVRVYLSRVRVPLKLEVGVLRRLQLGVSLPIVRGEMLVERFGLDGPAVGANPSPTQNATLLGRLGGNGAALGALPLLPTEESAAGKELQRRVFAATGDSLTLASDSTVSASVLQGLLARDFGVDSIHRSRGLWRPGDLEVEARFTLLDQARGEAFPAGRAGTFYRAALVASVRIPTASATQDSVRLFQRDPEAGFTGAQLGLVGDAFVGRRWWIGFGVREVVLTSANVVRRVAPLDAPLSTDAPAAVVEWNPPDTLELRVSPRYRVARLISVGADYRAGWLTASRYGGSAAGVLDTPGGVTQRVGIGVRFTSIPAFAARETGLPFEFSASYTRAISGPAGSGRESGAQLSGSVLTSLWGRGLRE